VAEDSATTVVTPKSAWRTTAFFDMLNSPCLIRHAPDLIYSINCRVFGTGALVLLLT
jgi:hypothetical protein